MIPWLRIIQPFRHFRGRSSLRPRGGEPGDRTVVELNHRRQRGPPGFPTEALSHASTAPRYPALVYRALGLRAGKKRLFRPTAPVGAVVADEGEHNGIAGGVVFSRLAGQRSRYKTPAASQHRGRISVSSASIGSRFISLPCYRHRIAGRSRLSKLLSASGPGLAGAGGCSGRVRCGSSERSIQVLVIILRRIPVYGLSWIPIAYGTGVVGDPLLPAVFCAAGAR